MHPAPRRIFPVVILIALGLATWWYLAVRVPAQADDNFLSASGTIEAVEVVLSAEVSSSIRRVEVFEGDQVTVGQVLIRLDDSLLQAQIRQAQAALEQAQANYDLIAAGLPVEQRQLAIDQAELELISAQQSLDELESRHDLHLSQAQYALAVAEKSLDKAGERLDNIEAAADPADVDAAWAAVVLTEDRLETVREDFEPYERKSEDNVVRAMLQAKLAEAQTQYDAVVTRYNNIIGSANQFDLGIARAEVQVAEAQRADALRQFQDLEKGPDPDTLALAEQRLALARSRLAAAQADPSSQQLAVAAAQVSSAEAGLHTLEVQLNKFILKAPSEGIVLERAVEPGESTVPGAPVLTLARLDSLSITVYVPEDRYGLIRLGQSAIVTVDSFPGQNFTATVARVATEAEFTPRNVQTEEGRRTTVFAIELAIANPDGQLKPGMPADVQF